MAEYPEVLALRLENVRLEHRVESLEAQWENHDCTDDWDWDSEHPDCIEQDEHDRIVRDLEAKAEIFDRVVAKREELWWDTIRALDGGEQFSLSPEQVISLLDGILENPR